MSISVNNTMLVSIVVVTYTNARKYLQTNIC